MHVRSTQSALCLYVKNKNKNKQTKKEENICIYNYTYTKCILKTTKSSSRVQVPYTADKGDLT